MIHIFFSWLNWVVSSGDKDHRSKIYFFSKSVNELWVGKEKVTPLGLGPGFLKNATTIDFLKRDYCVSSWSWISFNLIVLRSNLGIGEACFLVFLGLGGVTLGSMSGPLPGSALLLFLCSASWPP